jgi:hypothetical protein
MYKCLLIKCHRQNKPFPAHRHGPKGVFFGCKELSGKGAKEAKTQRNSWKSGIALRLLLPLRLCAKKFSARNVSFGICNYTRLSSIFTPR